jgi:hypothetical protein
LHILPIGNDFPHELPVPDEFDFGHASSSWIALARPHKRLRSGQAEAGIRRRHTFARAPTSLCETPRSAPLSIQMSFPHYRRSAASIGCAVLAAPLDKGRRPGER